MSDETEQLNKARAAKEKALDAFRALGQVCGVGITRKNGMYAVKVNLESEVEPSHECPQEIDGVPVVVQVVGTVRKQ